MNNYPNDFGWRMNPPPLEGMLGKFILFLLRPVFPDYVQRRIDYKDAPMLGLNDCGLYGVGLWHLPNHEISWDRLKTFEYKGKRVFELAFEPMEIKSRDRKNRISKVRVSLRQEVVQIFAELLRSKGIREIPETIK